MIKEAIIKSYLIYFKLIFNIFKLYPQKNKITLVVSFEENTSFIYREMKRQEIPFKIIILSTSPFSYEFRKEIQDTLNIPFEIKNVINWFKSVYHLATSKFVIIDNYFAFLSVINFKRNVECIQVWHAAGALKTFGLQDNSIVYRSKSANKRFRKVYGKFNKVVVGSEEMVSIFKDSFGLPSGNILRTGIPRTDFFYEKAKQEEVKVNFEKNYPRIQGKKIVLYAPTFRDSQLLDFEINLDIEKMYQNLKDNYILFIKLHPAVNTTKKDYKLMYPDFVYDFSSYKRMNELLFIADVLITDYSSIPFEFALLKKPMIFFPYDLEFYKKERGVIENYESVVPGPIHFDTDQIIQSIVKNEYDFGMIQAFSDKWNKYSTGESSKKLVNYIMDKYKK
ncbi:CDP-glycerol glycerophosphotransferase family protein [Neobacillus jeddahensis]|uniref:CDP-glycerol glycerophosphotransferase family protein n=1 Tax=Neobacillus jeddahensis TaxID=1461580 RepID=UPI00058AE65C|nr:CDP-glycerol glycerophosphotransferase family protein [Neobacillus jeddahensis]